MLPGRKDVGGGGETPVATVLLHVHVFFLSGRGGYFGSALPCSDILIFSGLILVWS